MAQDPIRPTDDQARALARQLMREARFGALAVILNDGPHVTRIALAPDETGAPVTLISDLAPHTGALRAAPRASLLVGEPGPKGDPLTHPRLSLSVTATFIEKSQSARDAYLEKLPKSKLYIDFADFHLVRLTPVSAHLNGGFGKAFHLSAADLGFA